MVMMVRLVMIRIINVIALLMPMLSLVLIEPIL